MKVLLPPLQKSIIAIIATLFTVACDKPGNDPITPDALSITPTSATVSAEGESKTVTITTLLAWTASADKEWCTLSAKSGTGESQLTVTAAANSDKASRTATVTIQAGELVKKFELTQLGTEPVFKLDRKVDSILTAQAGQIELLVTTNLEFEVAVDQDWIEVAADKAASTKAAAEKTIILNYQQAGISPRSATVTIKAGELTESIEFIQLPTESNMYRVSFGVDPETGFNQDNLSSKITITGEDQAVGINASTEILNVSTVGKTDWFTALPTQKGQPTVRTLLVQANTTAQNRSATIVFEQKDRADTLYLTQTPGQSANFLTLSHTNLTAPSLSCELSFTAASNSEHSATVNQGSDWLTVGKATNKNTYKITATFNPSTTERTGKILVTAGSQTKEITVTQNGKAYLDLNCQSIINVGSGAQTIEIEVKSSQPWITAIPIADWIKRDDNLVGYSGTAKFVITANTNSSTRNAVIKFNTPYLQLDKSVSVIQQGAKEALLELDSTQRTVTDKAGKTTVTIISSGDWTIATMAPWATASKASGSAGNTVVEIQYEANTAKMERSASFVIVTADKQVTFTLLQKGKPEPEDEGDNGGGSLDDFEDGVEFRTKR